MPEPVSVFAASAATAALSLVSLRSTTAAAFSAEGRALESRSAEIYQHERESFAIFGNLKEAQLRLQEAVREAAVPGWDGCQAPAVSASAFDLALEFLAALPPSVPMPEFAVEPDDGAISLEWCGGPRRLFSVSIGNSPRLAYAGINGGDKWHGVAAFSPSPFPKIPDIVLASIKQVMS